MQVAVPVFGDRVSPRFDCAVSFLMLTIDDGEIVARRELDASQWAPHERINRLVARGVDVVLCGGIDRWSAESLRSVGVSLVRSVAGPIDENLALLLRGELRESDMPPFGERCSQVGAGRDMTDEPRLGCSPHNAGQRGGGRRRRSGRRRGGLDSESS